MQKPFRMDNSTIFLSIIILVAGFIVYIFFWQRKTNVSVETSIDNNTRQMRLQAYERLTLLVDRIALQNLIARLAQSEFSAREMQMLLTQNIRQEFDYNITQQIYVSADAWTAVKNLKDQNMLVVNQFANSLPANATAMDLNKLLLEYLMNDAEGSLHDKVSQVLSFEAKKLL